MSRKTMNLSQDFFYHTGTRVFRLECSDLENVYKGDFRLGASVIPVVAELMERFVENYNTFKGKNFKKTSLDSYEVTLISDIASREFVFAINYIEEMGQINTSSSLYYFAVDFIV